MSGRARRIARALRATGTVGTLPTAAVLLAALGTTSCRTWRNPGGVDKVFEHGTRQVARISWDATRRGTFVIRDGNSVRIVSEPPPDAALDTIAKFSASFDPKKDGGKATLDSTETAKALSRAIEISFLREALYRMSEAYVNGAISQRLFELEFGQTVSVAAMLIAAGKDETGKAIELLAKITEARLEVVAKSDEAAALRARIEARVQRVAELTATKPEEIRAVIEMDGPEPSEMVGLIESEGLPENVDRAAVARVLDELRSLVRERDRIEAQLDVLASGLLPPVQLPR